ncbi:MAG: hypothetical protein M1839_007828 [Geoglossum umbratile]|nr:MAG: hypothetical protein M1839_007828 [Geoglossum umbratile]
MNASPGWLKRRASDADDGGQPEQPRTDQKKRRTLPLRNSPPHLHLKLSHSFPANSFTPQNSPTATRPPSDPLAGFFERNRYTLSSNGYPTCGRSVTPDSGQTARSDGDHEMLDYPVRMPTPIHGSFFPSSHYNEDVAMGNVEENASTLGHSQSRVGRRLPSPISEGEDKLQQVEANGEQMEIVQDSHNSNSESSSAATNTKASKSNQGSKLGDGRIPPTAVFGKGKVVFSMGYRADCEKCRNMVPGHYSHFVRV